MQGGDGNDILWGDNGGQSASHVGNGNDKLSGGAGDDELKGDAGNDTLDDGPGNDELSGMEGDDTLLSDPLGSDYLTGDGGIDTVDLRDRTADLKITIGVGGKDDGQAGEGDQTAQATERWLLGSGNDIVEDDWDDLNTFELGPGNDILYARRATDTVIGGDGTDTLSYAPYESPSRVYFPVRIDVPAGKVSSLDAIVDVDLTFSGFERYIGGDQADLIFGGLLPDYIQGGGGGDEVHGGALGDTIFGGSGDDELNGDGGDDVINGEDGADILNGGDGDDMLTGGPGKDTFNGGAPSGGDETDTTDYAGNVDDASCADAIDPPCN
jgi:Ca2+-binding RTX toxin-like protein